MEWHAACSTPAAELNRRSDNDVLKITTVQENPKLLRVQLYGQLTGEYVAVVEQALAGGGNGNGKVTLDLSQVTFVDRAGMKFLCDAKSRNVVVENIPSYVVRWIEQEGRCS
jgi:ABC-type transporter Mla MlaB component